MAVEKSNYPTQVWNGLSKNSTRRSRNDDVPPDPRDWDQLSAEIIAIEEALDGVGTVGISSGTLEAIDGLSKEQEKGSVRKVTFLFDEFKIATKENQTVQRKIFTFPTHLARVESSYFSHPANGLAARDGGELGLQDDALVTIKVGDLADDDAVFGEVFQISATPLAQFNVNSTASPFTNDGTPAELWLGVHVANSQHGPADDELSITGELVIYWEDLA